MGNPTPDDPTWADVFVVLAGELRRRWRRLRRRRGVGTMGADGSNGG